MFDQNGLKTITLILVCIEHHFNCFFKENKIYRIDWKAIDSIVGIYAKWSTFSGFLDKWCNEAIGFHWAQRDIHFFSNEVKKFVTFFPE